MNQCNHGKIYIMTIFCLIVLSVLIHITKKLPKDSKFYGAAITLCVYQSLCIMYLFYTDTSTDVDTLIACKWKHFYSSFINIGIIASSIFLVVLSFDENSPDDTAAIVGSVGLLFIFSDILSSVLCRVRSQ